MTEDNLEAGNPEASDVDLLAEGSEEENTEEESSEETTEEEIPEDETSEEEIPEEDTTDETEDEEIEEPTRPSWKEIKEKFPELAKNKDFQQVFHREKAFSEIFPSVEDARIANEKAALIEDFDTNLAQGNVSHLINALNDETLVKFTDKVLPSLRETNPKLFFRATRPVMVEMLNSVMNRANSTQDENLKISARNIARYLFGNPEVPKLQDQNNPEVEQKLQQLQTREQQLIEQQSNEFFGSIDRSIGKQLQKTIEDGIDPKGELSDFTRNAIIEKTLNEVRATISTDPNFVRKVQQLALLAKKNGFAPDYRPKLISAYLGRAKQLALTLRAKHKSAAIGKRAPVSKTKIENKGSNKPNNTQTSTKGKKQSDLDIILEGS